MKTINSFYAVLTLVAASLLFMTSCSKDSVIVDSANESQFLVSNNQIADDISVENGMLAFESVADFQGTVLALNKMTRTEIAAWEADLNFTAAFTKFVNTVKAEAKHKGNGHSAMYQDNLNKNLIVALEDGTYELNIFSPAYAVVLNDDFKVKVGDQIYQYTDNAVKIWTGNDVQEIMVETTERNSYSASDNCLVFNENKDIALETTLEYYSSNTEIKEKGSILFIEMSLTVKALLVDEDGNYEYAKDFFTEGTYKYEAEMRYISKDDGKVVSKVMEGDGQIKEDESPIVYILTEASGSYDSPDENGWAGPAKANHFSIDVASTIKGEETETLNCTVEL